MFYINTILKAMYICPVVALCIAGIYLSIQYRTYGSVSLFRTFILHTFLLYCMAAYFLVIFPLPDPAEVATRTTPYVQLIPFNVVKVFFEDSGFKLTSFGTYIAALKSREFLQPAFNCLLTVPLGCYLRYYFKCSTKKALGISFGFTLFFELTQLSGLYGFYTRPYRVCDVDDLILNTLGSMIGFYLTGFVMKILPKRETIDAKAIEKGKSITAVRRIFAKCIDLMFVCITSIGILALGCMGLYMLYTNGVFDETLDKYKTISDSLVTILLFAYFVAFYLIYTFLTVFVFKGNSIGKKLTGIRVCDDNYETPSRLKIFMRFILYTIWLVCIPILYAMISLGYFIPLVNIAIIFGSIAVPIVVFVKMNSKDEEKKRFIYEKISRTRLVSYASKGQVVK